MSFPRGLRIPLVLAVAVLLVLAVVAEWFWGFSDSAPPIHNTPEESPTLASKKPPDAVNAASLAARNVPLADTAPAEGEAPPHGEATAVAPVTPTWLELFEKRFAELAGKGDLDKFLAESVRDAPSLAEFLPVLARLLAGMKGDGFELDSASQSVWLALRIRKDLKEHADALNTAFLTTESPLAQAALAPALSVANEGRNTASLRQHVEQLLRDRRRAAPYKETDHDWYWMRLIGAHSALARSMLDTIIYMESLRSGGLPDKEVHRYWSTYAPSGFYHRTYDAADVSQLVDYLIAHTTERLDATADKAVATSVLKKIWENFREEEAYNRGLQHAQGLSDAELRKVWEEVLAHWKSKKPAD